MTPLTMHESRNTPGGDARALRPQFRLAFLLLLVTATALLAALLFAVPARCVYELQCTRLPPDDAALSHWLAAQQGARKVRVVRRQQLVHIEFYTIRPFWQIAGTPRPPWKELGYDCQRFSLHTFHPAPGYYIEELEHVALPLAVLAMVLVYLLRRHAALRRHPQSSPHVGPSPQQPDNKAP